MDSSEKGWRENREDYLRYADSALRAEEGKLTLNEVVKWWERLSGDASKSYFWRALETFQQSGKLQVEENFGRKLFSVEPMDLEELDQVMEEAEYDFEEIEKVRRKAGEGGSLDHWERYGGTFPKVPVEIAEEHFERNGYETFRSERDGYTGIVARDSTRDNRKETWMGVYNHLEDEEDHVWMVQRFLGFQPEEGESVEEIYDRQNRESYADRRWEDEIQTIRQRCNYIWKAAVKAVEEVVPKNVEDYNRKVETYEDSYKEEIDEIESVERQFRLIVRDDSFDPEKNYPEEIAEGYYEGDIQNRNILMPVSEKVETGNEEGDMPLKEATRDSNTSRGKRERNQAYLTHYLDLVHELSQAKYGEDQVLKR